MAAHQENSQCSFFTQTCRSDAGLGYSPWPSMLYLAPRSAQHKEVLWPVSSSPFERHSSALPNIITPTFVTTSLSMNSLQDIQCSTVHRLALFINTYCAAIIQHMPCIRLSKPLSSRSRDDGPDRRGWMERLGWWGATRKESVGRPNVSISSGDASIFFSFVLSNIRIQRKDIKYQGAHSSHHAQPHRWFAVSMRRHSATRRMDFSYSFRSITPLSHVAMLLMSKG